MSLAAGEQPAAFGERIGHVCIALGDGAVVHQRADLDAGRKTVADFQRSHTCRERGEEIFIDRVVDEDPVGGEAILPAGLELGRHRRRHGRVEIDVGENDERRVSAKLHRHALDGVGALAKQLLADLGRAGEAEGANDRAGAEFADDRFRRPGDDVEHAGR